MPVTIECMSTPIVAGFATLPASEAKRVRARHPELETPEGQGPTERHVVVALTARDEDEAAQIADLVTAARSALSSQRGALREVIDALLPVGRLTMSPALLEQAQRNATARAELADEFGLLSSADVAELAGSRAANAAALASRWRKEGRVFAVEVDAATRYPGFQFDPEGRAVPVVAKVLAALGSKLSGWELALWFTGSNDWLGGVRPVDVLTSAPEQVAGAARALADELLG
jgi:hypothetical protein